MKGVEELQQRAARARDSAVETLNDEKLGFQSTLRSAETGQPKNPAAASMQGSNGVSGGAATKGHSEIFGVWGKHWCVHGVAREQVFRDDLVGCHCSGVASQSGRQR